jgi:sigma-E factor negative regulatory protein RseB
MGPKSPTAALHILAIVRAITGDVRLALDDFASHSHSPRINQRFLKFLLISSFLLDSGAVLAEQETARGWLEQMSQSVQSTNYRGRFVYQHADRIEAMSIVHAGKSDNEWEKLSSLTGPKREVIRNNQMVTCILGDKQSVVLNISRPRQPFPAGFPDDLGNIENHYSFQFLGNDRVAGIECRLIAIRPRDQYRYGQRLCISLDNKILLRSELTGEAGKVIEQVMFTQIEFPDTISEQELRPDYQNGSYHWVREPELSFRGKADYSPDSNWRFTNVPDGFMQTSHNWHNLSEADPAVEHWVYSDGLASVSVYIEKAKPKDDEFYTGISRRGALNAFGTMLKGHYVTVVGEVPIVTLETIGNSVQHIP